MQWRIVSTVFLGVWLSLLAGDFCDDLGFFDDDNSEADQALDVALADLGQAIDTSDHSDVAPLPVSIGQTSVAHPSLTPCVELPTIPRVSLSRVVQKSQLVKQRAKIHELDQVFLI
jgi:hypothetical protein